MCKSWTHWIEERHLILFIYNTNHCGLILKNLVGKQLRSRFGVPPHSVIWIISRWLWKTGTSCPILPQIQYAKTVDQELTEHWYITQVGRLKYLICLQHTRWWSINVICCCNNGQSWHTLRLLRNQGKYINHEDIWV